MIAPPCLQSLMTQFDGFVTVDLTLQQGVNAAETFANNNLQKHTQFNLSLSCRPQLLHALESMESPMHN